ncbi:MAG: exodeoxyribonuclease VII large subunit [Clostridiales bacterium]|nr:exodeoxyribonuclease VII large subunit [Clostridiales bacterium]
MDNSVFSVTDLNEYVSTLLSQDSVLCQLCVKGEISGYKRYPSGHAYFQLKDEKSSVSCVVFKGSFQHIAFVPENGMKVLLFGRAALYGVDGKFQIIGSFMQEEGQGELFKQFELLKQKMQAQGLFDADHKKPIPFLPRRIGVVSSPKGAVIQDIINVLNRRFPNYDLLLYPSAVQGKEASTELIRGIRTLDAREDIDVIIVARGGGSMEDLWCFNDEALGRTIYEAQTPIISAVGHETDYTICDFCADLRAPTPSAAAELVMPNKEEVLLRLNKLSVDLRSAADRMIRMKSHKQDLLSQHRALMLPQVRIQNELQRCDQLAEKMKAGLDRKLSIYREGFASDLAKLEALNPMSVLLRGYSYVTDGNSRTVDSVKCVNINETITIHVSDGQLGARVISKSEKEG